MEKSDYKKKMKKLEKLEQINKIKNHNDKK